MCDTFPDNFPDYPIFFHQSFTMSVKGALLIVLLLLANVAIAAHGDLDEKIARATEQIVAAPGDAALYLKRGQLYLQHEDWALARTDLRTARRLDETMLVTEFLLAQVCLGEHNLAGALVHADTYLRAIPDAPEALVTRAGIYHRLNNHAACREDLARALSLFSPPVPAHYVLIAEAVMLDDATNVDEALHWLDTGLARFGTDIVLRSKKIDLLERAARYPDALIEVDVLLQTYPRKERWLYRKALLLEAAQRHTEARKAILAAQTAIIRLPTRLQRTTKILELEADCLTALARLDASAK